MKLTAEGILWQEDYHDSMNGDSYEQYFANSLCTNVPQGSLIVIDNAPYHSRNDKTYPVSKWKKQQYIDWLKSKDIAVPKKFRKRHAELKDQPEFWKKCMEKVKRIEEDYRKSDISVDIQVEKLCVELHPDSSSDSDELECLSSETFDTES